MTRSRMIRSATLVYLVTAASILPVPRTPRTGLSMTQLR